MALMFFSCSSGVYAKSTPMTRLLNWCSGAAPTLSGGRRRLTYGEQNPEKWDDDAFEEWLDTKFPECSDNDDLFTTIRNASSKKLLSGDYSVEESKIIQIHSKTTGSKLNKA